MKYPRTRQEKAGIILILYAGLFLIFSSLAFSAGFVLDPTSRTWYSPDKDNDAVLDYSIDWTAWLAGDKISSSIWTAGAGITIQATSSTDYVATVWVSGGTAGQVYLMKNKIVTTGGRTTEQSFRIRVKEL
jgi:hypothetical protein